jgi:hypothetical protein
VHPFWLIPRLERTGFSGLPTWYPQLTSETRLRSQEGSLRPRSVLTTWVILHEEWRKNLKKKPSFDSLLYIRGFTTGHICTLETYPFSAGDGKVRNGGRGILLKDKPNCVWSVASGHSEGGICYAATRPCWGLSPRYKDI